ncbi:SusC/RagA family TonB-linked outer membrane protein [Capnocytophaga catalasegens]|uniref:SusC/RagA family TonB-linked outer membrane protein n=1 Tax=Capnocytophaga catalasegens TaxID=1004260 RepID=UPI00285295E7|nr:SusC/RagA family TonB-linked outer membrane protein [Capnocytophaga catalasegens]
MLLLKIADNNEILLNKAIPRSSTQQVKQITGLVKDSKGEPLPGATVIEKGTTNGTTTDLNGNFALSVAPNAVLEISYIGYGTKNVSVVGKTNFIIELEEETNTLDEVVIIGYGAIKKADVAGAVSVLDNKNFKDQPVTQISDIFQGRVSGVQVDNSSVPGGSVRIRIRGASSINRSNDPLYVIDGIVRESGLTGLNPDDIESLQILKDASSTAIYGSRGSNGVVLITTKMGKSNKKFISIDSNVTLSSVYKRYSVLSPYEYAMAYREIKNPNAFTDQEMEAYKNGTAGIDWQDEIFRNAFTKNYKISISSGNQDTQYYISANHMSQEGITIGNSNERYQIRLNLNSDITNWLQVTTDFNASRNFRKGGGFGAHKGNPIWVALNYSPTMEIMDEQGNYNRDPYNYQGINPLGVLETNKSENLNYIVNGKVDLKFKISPNLTFTTTNGVDYYNTKGYSFESKRVSVSSSMNNADNYRFLLQTSNNLTYNLQLDKHSFTLTGVGEYSTSESRGMNFSGANLLTESVDWWDVIWLPHILLGMDIQNEH